MNALEQFHIDLDLSGWDVKQESDINHALQEVNEILSVDGLLNVLQLADIDRQAFHFSKSPEKRLSFRSKGTQRFEDGSEVPFEWPEIKNFNKDDFEYLFNRFKTCTNTYAKTEYGLVLFYSKQKLDHDFVIELLHALFELLKTYVEKAKSNEDKDHYIIHARTVLANALFIANNGKGLPEVEVIFRALIEYTFEVHQKWDITRSSSLRAIIDFTDFALQYFNDFKKNVQVNKFISKNWEVAKYLSKSYVWGAIYVANISMKLCRKLEIELKEWLYFKADQYEKLSSKNKGVQNLASLSFVEDAMSIYKRLKDKENLSRLQKEYQQLRTEFNIGGVSQEIPQDETQRIMELIKKEIEEKNEEEIIETLLLTPMIGSLADIKKWSEESFKEPLLQNLMPVIIHDKFGNTIALYKTDDEKKRFSLLRTYEFHMQIATQTIMQYFIAALRAEKISANGVIRFLNQTWIGDKAAIRQSNGTDINISYIKIVEAGIRSFFEELLKWKNNPNYDPNFVSATDSLILKSEYLLREFCTFLGIPTFKQKDENVVMERTLDDIMRDDQIMTFLTEDDHFFIKFILTEKAGYNLRNRIAHGLLDDVEYGLQYPILALIIILKLSNYQFKQIKNE